MDGSKCNLYGVKDNESYQKPRHFQEMVNYANLLSNRFKFVRVDFYEINNQVYFGELTFYPGAILYKDVWSEMFAIGCPVRKTVRSGYTVN